VFTLLNGFHAFDRWSPWAQLDASAEYRLSGPDQGEGARLDWRGDPALVGEGSQVITLSEPNRRIETHLDFGPQGVADAYFDIRGDQLGSSVTWGFDTDVTEGQGFVGGLLGRWFGLFLDRWVGADYEQGLASLKAYAESLPASDFSKADIELVELAPQTIQYVSGSSSPDGTGIAEALAAAYGQVMDFITLQGIEVTGPPLAVTRSVSEDQYQFDAAIPVDAGAVDPDGVVKLGHLPTGRAARIVHVGPYADTPESYAQLAAWLAAHGLPQGEVSWEHYISDPGDTPENELITNIYVHNGELGCAGAALAPTVGCACARHRAGPARGVAPPGAVARVARAMRARARGLRQARFAARVAAGVRVADFAVQ
jgi:effector-binding domain-containing protein